MPRKSTKDANRPRGRMTAYAFFLQMCRDEHRRQHPSEQIAFTVFSKQCAQRWKQLPGDGKEKKKFQAMAAKDSVRYTKEMANYKPHSNQQQATTTTSSTADNGNKEKKVRQRKDPSAPKRSLSAFLYFSQDERPKVMALHPQWRMSECAKELGKRWADIQPEARATYDQMAAIDKERYVRDIADWKAKQQSKS